MIPFCLPVTGADKAVHDDGTCPMPEGSASISGLRHPDFCRGGFTLVEVMVAMVLLGLFALASFRSLDAVLSAERHARLETQRWQELARAFNRIESDLSAAVVLPTADGRFAFVSGNDAGREWCFVRQRPQDQGGGSVDLCYQLAGGKLTRIERETRSAGSAGRANSLLIENISQLHSRLMDSSGHWREDWPAERAGTLPRALEWRFIFDDGVELKRVWKIQ